MHKNVTGKDLTREAPRSPRIRVGGYAILGRTIEKCRALVAGNIGEYHFDCPLDNMLFGFKGVKGEDLKAQIENGASDQEMVEWLNRNGAKKTPDEIKLWGDEVTRGRLSIRTKQKITPRIGNSGTNGTRNGLGRLGCVRRKTMTPRQTRMKAKSVPMLVRSASEPISTTAAMPPTKTPVQIVVICGVRNFG